MYFRVDGPGLKPGL